MPLNIWVYLLFRLCLCFLAQNKGSKVERNVLKSARAYSSPNWAQSDHTKPEKTTTWFQHIRESSNFQSNLFLVVKVFICLWRSLYFVTTMRFPAIFHGNISQFLTSNSDSSSTCRFEDKSNQLEAETLARNMTKTQPYRYSFFFFWMFEVLGGLLGPLQGL